MINMATKGRIMPTKNKMIMYISPRHRKKGRVTKLNNKGLVLPILANTSMIVIEMRYGNLASAPSPSSPS
jgi:hypothetical protein